ncbi:MAG: hypothetical protein WAX69_03825, partial [Victivallales bacterium]
MRRTALSILTAVLALASLQSWSVDPQDTFVWTMRTPAGAGVTKYWSAVAMNSDGTKLLACAQMASGGGGDYVYTSTDGGGTWSKRQPAGTGVPKFWSSAAINSDGTKMVVCAEHIYTSIYGGASWVKRAPAGANVSKNWYSVAMSSDGTRIVACAYNDYVYTSTDGGASWVMREPAGASTIKKWYSVATSSDGTKITAVAYDDYVYTSTDSGVAWTKREPAGLGTTRQWGSVAMSSDGSVIAVCTEGDFLVYASTDSGASWTPRDPSSGAYSFGSAVTMNSAGTKLVACPLNSDYIYNSSDVGASWNQSAPNGVGVQKDWWSISMSGDGVGLAACAHDNDYVYTATNNKQVNFQAGADGTLSGSTSQSIPLGMDCTPVTAVPAANYHLVNWTGDGGFVTTSDNPLTVADVSNSMTITADFAHDQGTIATEAIGNGTIDVGIGPYDTMTLYDISATAGGGYTFVNFSVFGSATLEATTSPTQFKLTGLDGCTAKITVNFLDDANVVTPDPVVGDTDSFTGISEAAESSMVYRVAVP